MSRFNSSNQQYLETVANLLFFLSLIFSLICFPIISYFLASYIFFFVKFRKKSRMKDYFN